MGITAVANASGIGTPHARAAPMMVIVGVRPVVIVGWSVACSRRSGEAGSCRRPCRALARRRCEVVFPQPHDLAQSDLPEGEPYAVPEYERPGDVRGLLSGPGPGALAVKYVDSSPAEPEGMDESLQSGARSSSRMATRRTR
jgi:hypothetical protein